MWDAPGTGTLVQPEPLEQMPTSWPHPPLLVVALEYCNSGEKWGCAVFQLTRVYMAILTVKILKQPALAYPLSPLHAPFPSGVRPHFNRPDRE